ncbi:stage II sporulation protein M [Solwaraspora sp. WMMD1047]|uniref:stage II sporulation protein M n=1 Tax=Solwaraspora sp. WMMD1047 TaxID=3016102 RepID=UPI002417E0B6|nr:stage II sporulation protein M [Solwaraspora sp. WMMD1047]MDG4832689.1 stage II sporulation protein M [Solwaraspora sp. WMMD1047]
MERSMARGVAGQATLTPFLASLAILAAGIYVGHASMDAVPASGAGAEDAGTDSSFLALLSFFLLRNLGAALLFFSGVLTGGVSTLLSWGITALYIGATFTAAAANVGFSAAFASIVWYAPLEILGLVLAATAGLYPISAVLRSTYGRADSGDQSVGYLTTYLRAIRVSVRVLAVAVVIIVAAAVIEATTISLR